jgi:hypothetical protein
MLLAYSLHGVATEEEARYRHGNENDRTKRKYRIVGESRPHPRIFMRHPVRGACLDQCPHRFIHADDQCVVGQ